MELLTIETKEEEMAFLNLLNSKGTFFFELYFFEKFSKIIF
jgi:hypothetical protein